MAERYVGQEILLESSLENKICSCMSFGHNSPPSTCKVQLSTSERQKINLTPHSTLLRSRVSSSILGPGTPESPLVQLFSHVVYLHSKAFKLRKSVIFLLKTQHTIMNQTWNYYNTHCHRKVVYTRYTAATAPQQFCRLAGYMCCQSQRPLHFALFWSLLVQADKIL